MVVVNPPDRRGNRQHIVASGSFAMPWRPMNTIIPNEPKRTIQIVEWYRPIDLLPHHMQDVTIKTIDDKGERWTWWGVVYDWNHRQWFNTEDDGTLTPVTGRVFWWADDIEGPDTPEDLES